MKNAMKHLLTLTLALLLVLSVFGVPMQAAETGSITINNTVPGKKYLLYRVFDLTYQTIGGQTAYDYTISDEFQAFFAGKGITTDADAASYVAAFEDNAEAIQAFADEVKTFALTQDPKVDPAVTIYCKATSHTESNLPLGYYLVYPEAGVTAACSLTTTNPTSTVEVKTEYPTLDKVIVEDETEKQHTTAKVGDSISFKLTGKVPDTTGYESYMYQITDVLAEGFTFNNDTVITVNGDRITLSDDYQVSLATVGGLPTVRFTFRDMVSKYNDCVGEDIIITYSVTLNSNAVVGALGNPNQAELTYSSNPYLYTSHMKTPTVSATVFTFRLDGEKVDANNTDIKLKDAVFSLYTSEEIAGAATKVYETDGSDPITLYLINSEIRSETNGKFSHSVKTGTYYLFEETAPDGYNKMSAPIIFDVSPVFNEQGELLSLTIDNTDLSSVGNSGVISTMVKNNTGVLLPSTGGIGVVIFTVSGILLMGGAIAAFVFYRKKSKGI